MTDSANANVVILLVSHAETINGERSLEAAGAGGGPSGSAD